MTEAPNSQRQSSFSLRGAAVLLCGATGGIGAPLAAELHRRGARLALVARDQRRLEELDVPGARLARDLRTPTACSEAVRFAAAHHGRLDVLINAVGVVAFGPLQSLPDQVLRELFEVNALTAVMLAARAIDALTPGGAIVNLSGAIAERNLPRVAAYGASKAAIRSLDEALARELRLRRIRVIDARPPHTETPLMRRALHGEPPNLGPGIPPDRVAEVICAALEGPGGELGSEAFTLSAA
jgi:cyclic-di-GMP-binding biofilm dispersal mediator protein